MRCKNQKYMQHIVPHTRLGNQPRRLALAFPMSYATKTNPDWNQTIDEHSVSLDIVDVRQSSAPPTHLFVFLRSYRQGTAAVALLDQIGIKMG